MKLLKVEKAIIFGLVIAIAASTISGFSAFAVQCQDIRTKVLRLHILANSDSAKDQQLKINVRNAILTQSKQIFGDAKSKQQAEDNVKRSLAEIKKIANDEIKKEGYHYSADAKLVNMYFTTRTYGSLTLPAGDYDAVRVTIGKAQGHNWWCVLFPALCLPAVQDDSKNKLSDVLDPNEVHIVESYGNRSVVIKFKSLEILEQFNDFLKQHGI